MRIPLSDLNDVIRIGKDDSEEEARSYGIKSVEVCQVASH